MVLELHVLLEDQMVPAPVLQAEVLEDRLDQEVLEIQVALMVPKDFFDNYSCPICGESLITESLTGPGGPGGPDNCVSTFDPTLGPAVLVETTLILNIPSLMTVPTEMTAPTS